MPPSKTANPDTPADELAQLAARYPAQALANPVLPLLLLENPAWFEELPEKTLLALLGAVADGPTPAPPALLAAATPHKSAAMRAAAARLPALGAAARTAALHDADPAVRDAACLHPLATLPPAEVPRRHHELPAAGPARRAGWGLRRARPVPAGRSARRLAGPGPALAGAATAGAG